MSEVNKVCAVCGKSIEIDINNICGVAKLQNKYYHPDCLSDLAAKRIQRKSHAECWDYAHEHLSACEKDAREAIYRRYWQDKLNDHLLKHYDVVVIPSRFWEVVADLGKGVWRGKRCRAVPLDVLCGCWIWGQRTLDDINRKNKSMHKGPETDEERVRYDLAIVLQHIGDYERAKAKAESEKNEAIENAATGYDEVDMTRVGKTPTKIKRDLSDIANDIL